MMKPYVLALDQGTTSSRAILFNHKGDIVGSAQKEFPQSFPQPGWVEQDPMEIWGSQSGVAREVLEKTGIRPDEVAAMGITNQRETTILWNRQTGKPYYHAIVWQCRRTAAFCNELKKQGLEPLIQEKTGLVLDAYFSATKIRWILDHVPEAKQAADEGNLLFGTVDTWLIWNLTRGKVHATDYSNASRTMLLNIHTGQWDEELLHILGIPASILPEIKNSSDDFGFTHEHTFGGTCIPIAACIGDQQAALFGQACFDSGSAKNTYGTGCFLLMNTGDRAISSQHGLLTTIAWSLENRITYALEGSIFMGGASIQWLRDNLRLIYDSAESEYYARLVKDSAGVYFVPAFTGLGAPWWDMEARGLLIGLTRGTQRPHIVRAVLESIAFQCADVLEAMEKDSSIPLKDLRVDGGASTNNFLMEYQAHILGVQVHRPAVTETTALGAAYLAGLYVGFWKDLQDIRQNGHLDRTFLPAMAEKELAQRRRQWKKAVQRSMAWHEQEEEQ